MDSTVLHSACFRYYNAPFNVFSWLLLLFAFSDPADLQIGFQLARYDFNEPQFEEEISGVVFLEKQNGRITEQSYVVIIGINEATPNVNIRAATLSTLAPDNVTVDADNDYVVTTPGLNTIVLEFAPDEQVLDFRFVLFPDDIAEGTEAFQASSQPSENPLHPSFTAPSAGVLFPSTFIVIADDDRKFGCIIISMWSGKLMYIYKL